MEKFRITNTHSKGAALVTTVSVVLSIVSALLLCLVSAILIDKQIVTLTSIKYITLAIHLISTFIGCMSVLGLCKGRGYLNSCIVAGIYFTILMSVNLLVYADGISGLITTAVAIALGANGAYLLSLRLKAGKRKHFKVRSR